MDEITRLLNRAAKETAPAKKRALLNEALALDPHSLPALQQLLYLGRLGLKKHASVDYSEFRCYVLNLYDEPEKYTAEQAAAITEELTNAPELQACLTEAPDRDAFLKEYLQYIAVQYVRVFMENDNHRNGSMLGIRLGKHNSRMARYGADMLCHVQQAGLPAPFDTLLPDALLQAFERCWGNAEEIEAMLMKE